MQRSRTPSCTDPTPPVEKPRLDLASPIGDLRSSGRPKARSGSMGLHLPLLLLVVGSLLLTGAPNALPDSITHSGGHPIGHTLPSPVSRAPAPSGQPLTQAASSTEAFSSQAPSSAIAGVILSPSAGTVGSVVTAQASSYLPNELLSTTFGGRLLSYSGCSVGTLVGAGLHVQANAGGAFACRFTVPAAPHGPHTLVVSAAASTQTSNHTLSAIDTISAGSGPWGAAYAPKVGAVYVADLNTNSVDVINDSTLAVTGSISVGNRPHGVVYDSGKAELFVANYDPGGPGSVSVIDPSTNSVVATVTVGSDPFELAYDAGRGEVFVTNFGSNGVSVINDTTNSVVATVTVSGGPEGIAYDSGKGELFVTAYRGGVSVISDSTNAVLTQVSVGNDPWAVAYDPARSEAFVTQLNGTQVSVISDSSNSVVATVTTAPGPTGVTYDPTSGAILVNVLNATGAGGNNGTGVPLPGNPGWLVEINDSNDTVVAQAAVGGVPVAVVYDSGTGDAFVANQYDGTVSVVGYASGAPKNTIPAGSGPWGIAYDTAKGELFVSDLNTASVDVINDSTNSVRTSVAVGYRPHGVVYDPARGEVLVANYDPGGVGTVSVINDTTNSVVANVTVGTDPFELAYDSGRGEIYVTNFGSNTVTAISGSSNQVVATVSVAGGPEGIAYDAKKGELFVTAYTGNVSVISDSTNSVVATVSVGHDPWSVAYDAAKGQVFVSQINGTNVSVISDSSNTVVATVDAGTGLSGVVYDPVAGAVLVNDLNATGAGGKNGTGVTLPTVRGSLVVINDTNDSVVAHVQVGVVPVSVAYDSGAAEAAVTNEYENTVSLVHNSSSGFTPFQILASLSITGTPSGAVGATVSFSGNGYVPISPIVVSFGGYRVALLAPCTTGADGSFSNCAFLVPAEPVGPYSVTATDSFSDGNVNPIQFQVTTLTPYTLTFTETGLGASASWFIDLGSSSMGVVIDLLGSASSTNLSHGSAAGTPVVFHVSNGRFQYSAGAAGYVTIHGTASVSGTSPPTVVVSFALVPNTQPSPKVSVPSPILSGTVLGVAIATIVALGLALTAYRYRTQERERARVLVDRLYQVADGLDSGSDIPPMAPPRGPG
jgi:YVTN family beta-propeller protein